MAALSQPEIVREFFERGWNHLDFERLSGSLSSQITLHWRGKAVETGLDGLKRVVSAWHEAFEDLCFTVDDVVVDGDTAAVRVTQGGTHRAVWKGVPATGRRFEISLMMFFRFEDRTLTEVWEVADEYSLWQQLGVLGEPADI